MKEFLDNGRFNSKNIIEDYRLIIDMVEGSWGKYGEEYDESIKGLLIDYVISDLLEDEDVTEEEEQEILKIWLIREIRKEI
jgi:hypothetical protein